MVGKRIYILNADAIGFSYPSEMKKSNMTHYCDERAVQKQIQQIYDALRKENPQALSIEISPRVIPYAQVTLGDLRLPPGIDFPGSKGVVDITIKWFKSPFLSSAEQQQISLGEKRWQGPTVSFPINYIP